MRVSPILTRLIVGMVIGSLGGVASPHLAIHSVFRTGMQIPLALASTDCDPNCCIWQNPGPPRFDGDNEWIYSNLKYVSTQISTATAGNGCLPSVRTHDWGNNYWGAITGGPSGNCGSPYAQMGWFKSADTSPTLFWERSNKNMDGNGICDPGPMFGAGVSGSNTYTTNSEQVSTSICQWGYRFDYSFNGSLWATQCADWQYGTNAAVEQEGDLQQMYTGNDNFRNLAYCAGASCVITNLQVSCTQYRGCTTTQNPYGCFAQRQWTGNYYNGFDVWDQRTTGGTC
jgi:hypothetical protein